MYSETLVVDSTIFHEKRFQFNCKNGVSVRKEVVIMCLKSLFRISIARVMKQVTQSELTFFHLCSIAQRLK